MGVPPEMDVYFHTAADAIAAHPEVSRRSAAAAFCSPATSRRCASSSTARRHAVNVGGIHSRAGRTQRLRYVFLAPDEEQHFASSRHAGAVVTAQDVPGARAVALDDLIAGNEQ